MVEYEREGNTDRVWKSNQERIDESFSASRITSTSEGKGEKEIKATILDNIDGKFILDFKAVQFYSVQDCSLLVLKVISNQCFISKKQICTCSTLFCTFVYRCFARLQCKTKTWSFLVTHYFLWGNCRMCSPKILLLAFSYSIYFLHSRSFSPCWPLVFLIFSPPLWNFHAFLPTKFVSFVFNHSL